MRSSRESTVEKMAESLLDYAEERKISLEGLTADNFNFFLDDVFKDGGYARCEEFVDLSDEYILGDLEVELASVEHENLRYEMAVEAIKLINKRLGQS